MARHEERATTLRLIAVFRLAKAVVLLAVAVGALKLLDPAFAHHVRRWIALLPFAARHPEIESAAHRLAGSPKTIEIAAAVATAYAALFAVEGVGLWMRKVWAEYLTIVATTSFVPFEIYELARRSTLPRVGALAINVAIVVYLIVRRVRAHRRSSRP